MEYNIQAIINATVESTLKQLGLIPDSLSRTQFIKLVGGIVWYRKAIEAGIVTPQRVTMSKNSKKSFTMSDVNRVKEWKRNRKIFE